MKIRFLSGAAVAYLRKAFKDDTRGRKESKAIVKLFADGTNDALLAHLKMQNIDSPLIDSRYECNPFSLDPHSIGADEVANIKSFCDSLKDLSPAIASLEGFWAGLCIDAAWNYVQGRWKITEKSSGQDILSHFFFGFGPRRSLTRNALSRLWWIGRLTRDDARADPYELTRFVLDDTDYVIAMLERNYSNNPCIVREFVSAVVEARAAGLKVDRDEIRELAKYINVIGGVSILDMMPRGAIHEKVLSRAKRLYGG